MLSDRAKVIAGGIFGITTNLHFGMEKSKPTAETQAALDELVAKGIVKRVRQGKAVQYRRLSDCSEYEKWAQTKEGKACAKTFSIVEPIDG